MFTQSHVASYVPSLICFDLSDLRTEIKGMLDSGIQRVHVDLIDPSYGPLGLPASLIADIKDRFDIQVEAHLMVQDVAACAQEVVRAGADAVLIPVDKWTFETRAILADAPMEITLGAALRPGQVSDLRPLINESIVDQATVMSVEPGGTGRPFVPASLRTIREVSELCSMAQADVYIESDGAVGIDTAPMQIQNGSRMLVLGTTVFPERRFCPDRLRKFDAGLRRQLTQRG